MPATPAPALVIGSIVIGLERNFRPCLTAWFFDRSDQINQNSRAYTVPPRGTGQTDSKASLNDVERSGSVSSEEDELPNLLSVCDVISVVAELVEPIGIEPTT